MRLDVWMAVMATAWLLAIGNPAAAAKAGGDSAPAAATRIYKWTDEAGVMHYGTSIPPQYADKTVTELNRRGMPIKRIDPPLTGEQRRLAELQAAQARDEQKRMAEQRRRDNALLNTYTSPREIDAARERNLAIPRQAIQGLQPRMQKAQERITQLQAQIERVKHVGKPVPEALQEDLERHQDEVEEIQAEVERHNAQIETIRARFDSDRQRYVELTQR